MDKPRGPTTHAPLDDMHARVAVDGMAARVVFGKVERYEPRKQVQTDDSPTPIAMRAAPPSEDLTGVQQGRLVVLGLAANSKRNARGAKWVVRCRCGTYTTRRTQALKNPANNGDRCEHCRHLAFLKREAYWRRTGKDADIADFFGD